MARNIVTEFAGNIRLVSDANVTISGLNNGDTIDSVVVATDDLVLLAAQTVATENGVYKIAAGAGDTLRDKAFNKTDQFFPGMLLRITAGTVYTDTTWQFGGTGNFSLDKTAAVFTELEADIGALNATLTSILTSVQLQDDTVGTIDAAFSGKVTVLGAKAESTVPTEVADADAVALWSDLFGRLFGAAHSLADGADQNLPLAEAARNTQETPFTTLTAPGDTTAVNVENYNDHTFAITIAALDTNVILGLKGSVGGTGFARLSLAGDPANAIVGAAVDEEQFTITVDALTYTLRVRGAFKEMKLTFESESGGTAATVAVVYRGGR